MNKKFNTILFLVLNTISGFSLAADTEPVKPVKPSQNSNILDIDSLIKGYAAKEFEIELDTTNRINIFLRELKKPELIRMLDELQLDEEDIDARMATNEWG